MSGTPEKILEHFLETIRLEPTLNEATGKYPEQCVDTLNHAEHCKKILSSSSVCVGRTALERGYA